MLARIAAFIAAVAMVAGALYVRGRSDEGQVAAGQGLVLVCVPEVERVCLAAAAADGRIELTVEEARVTRARLASASPADAPDGWLTIGALGQAVDEARGASAGRLFPTSAVVARSPLVAAIWKPAADGLRARCPNGLINWSCVAEATNAGAFRLGTAEPSSSEGLTVFAAFGAALLGDPDFGSNDLEGARRSDLVGLKDRTAQGRAQAGSLSLMLTTRQAVLDGYVTTEANAGTTLATAAAGRDVERVYLAPPATADLHLAARDGAAGRELGEQLRGTVVAGALRNNGFRVGTTPPSFDPAAPALPPDDGLPSPGVLAFLQDLLK